MRREDFTTADHRTMWAAMVTAQERYGVGSWDLMTLYTIAPDAPLLGRMAEYVMQTPTAIHARHYAQLVAEAAMRRRAVGEAERIIASAYDLGDSAETVAETVAHATTNVQVPSAESLSLSSLDRAALAIRSVEQRQGGDMGVMPFGFRELDHLTSGGARPSQLIIVGGRPGAGKSSLMRNFARSFEQSGLVFFASNEMSAEQIADRDLAYQSKIPLSKILAGDLSDKEWSQLTNAAGKIGDLRITDHIDGGMTTASLAAAVRDQWRKEPCKAIIVDYLQRMADPKGKGSDAERVESIAKALKTLAMEYRVPVIVGSQLNRDPEKRDGKRPSLVDLRQSGGIEQEADLVLLIHRADRVSSKDIIKPPEILIAKQRQGPVDEIVKVAWLGSITSFEDLDERHVE